MIQSRKNFNPPPKKKIQLLRRTLNPLKYVSWYPPPPPSLTFYIFFSFFLPIFLYSPKYFNPSRNNLTPPPPIILTSWKILAATFRNILTTQACNHLNQTNSNYISTTLRKKKNSQLFLKTFNPTDYRSNVNPSQKIAIPEKYLNNPE